MNPSDLKQLAEQTSVPINYLQYILEQIKSYIPDSTIWVFGSRIKGSHRPSSDLDLAVLCDKETAKRQLLRLNEIFIESDIPFKIQLLDFYRLPVNIQKNIKKQYFVLYQSERDE